MTEKIKILFLAANPINSGHLQLSKEVREIEKKILMAKERDRFELIQQGAVTPDDLHQALLRHKPHIVHFSGHGSKKSIVLENHLGKSKSVSKPALTDFFEILKDNISVIVLNACYSRHEADRLPKVFDYTIVVQTAISDKTAIDFAASFYQGLAHECSVKKAFKSANSLLKMKGVATSKLPELFIREGVDSDKPLLNPIPEPVIQTSMKPIPEPVIQPLPKPIPEPVVQPFSQDTLTVKYPYINPIPKRIMQITGGIILIIVLFFIWQYIESTKEARTEDKAKTELSNKALREERYTKAVNQLSSQTSVTGRVNAIDNLGKLASDPDFDDYYERIINTLVAFIRENSKLKKNGKVQPDEKISDDVQAALKILGWRRHKFEDGESRRLDLSDTYLPRVDLKRGTVVEGAHLEGAQFINANLDHAMLREVNLENAILIGANLRYANLYKANLQNTNLFEADLEEADLQWAKGLTIEQVKEAKNWNKAIFSQEFENKLRASK
jgi:hypothetical protein